MTLRIDENRDDKLGQLAQKHGLSKHETLLRLIDSSYERENFEADRSRFTAEVQQQFADVIRRLGE